MRPPFRRPLGPAQHGAQARRREAQTTTAPPFCSRWIPIHFAGLRRLYSETSFLLTRDSDSASARIRSSTLAILMCILADFFGILLGRDTGPLFAYILFLSCLPLLLRANLLSVSSHDSVTSYSTVAINPHSPEITLRHFLNNIHVLHLSRTEPKKISGIWSEHQRTRKVKTNRSWSDTGKSYNTITCQIWVMSKAEKAFRNSSHRSATAQAGQKRALSSSKISGIRARALQRSRKYKITDLALIREVL